MTRHDVVVIGAGPAGLAAARRLAEHGIDDVVVLEREQEPGGVPRHCGHPGFGIAEFARVMRGPGYARRLVRAAAGADLRTGVTVTRLLPGGEIEAVTTAGPLRLAGRAVLVALGARETPRSARLVSGTRPAGVMTTGALQQLVYLAGARPFVQPVIVGSELVSFSAILTLRHAASRPLAMIEENPRITARRPGDWIARTLLGVPVWTGTRVTAIHGGSRVEAVEIERRGRRERVACDGVVFTGRFVPEAALLADGPVEIDAGTGGPSIDQHWRCTDPAYFAAGNLLRPIETAATAWREGRAAADCIAAALAGELPVPERQVRLHWQAPLRYVYPQRLSLPGRAPGRLQLRARVSRPASGRLSLVVNGTEIWARRLAALPERRIALPVERVALDGLQSMEIHFAERERSPGRTQSAIKPQPGLTERSTVVSVSDKLTPGKDRAAE